MAFFIEVSMQRQESEWSMFVVYQGYQF